MIGTTLGPFRLDAELGSGGMGTVYRATGEGGVVVALKVIHPHLVADAAALARFRREAQVGISIRHANVVATLAAGEDGGRHWLALEYVEGQTLHALQEELGTVPEELCRHVAHEVAAGLAAIHAAGIVHRDVKPENVMIARCAAAGRHDVAERPRAQRSVSDGHVHPREAHVVKVMDLGVARGAEDDARVTQTGAFVGSLQYAAPEQFTGGGRGLDGRADLHALGVVLYELSAGANPYEDTDWRVVFQRVLKETPRRLGAVNPQVSPFFEELVHTLLAKDRDQRFASAAELVSVLDGGEDSPWWSARVKSIRGVTRRSLRRIRIPRETSLVGRGKEIALLRSLFERASKGEGQVVLIEGEAGIGKSRLVDEFAALLQREGVDLDFLYGSYPPGGAATASGAFTTAYREHFGSQDLATTLGGYLEETPLLVPGFAALLTNQAPPDGALALTKDSLQTCFVHATRAIAAERVAVVLIDDLHFAPEEGKALFASLAMAVPGHRILLVGTSRPPLDEKWAANIGRLGHTTRMGVGRLGAKDLAALLEDVLKSSHLAEELSLKIASSTDGNPFFVFEVLRGLKDGQHLAQRRDGTWATTGVLREIEIPSSVQELVQARLVDLSDDDRALLEVAACQGFEFDALLAGEVVGAARVPLMKTLGRIERANRLVRAVGNRYVFDHHQVQESLYGGLAPLVREQYHAATGDCLEARTGAGAKAPKDVGGALCVQLAEHFLRSAEGARALRYLDPALAHLTKNYLNDAAIGLAGRALAAEGLLVGEGRVDVLLRTAGRLDLLGRRDAQRAALDEALGLADACGDLAQRARVLAALGGMLWRTSRCDEARAALGEALTLARAAGDVRTECLATGTLGNVFQSLGRLAEAREQDERHLALARAAGDRRDECSAMVNLGVVLIMLGRLDEALDCCRRTLALARDIGDRDSECSATGNLGVVLRLLGRADEGCEQAERQLALAREIGDRADEANATGNLGNVFQNQGRLAEARAQYERHLALAQEIGDGRGEALATGNLADVLHQLGRLDDSRLHFERVLVFERSRGDRWNEGYDLGSLADLCAEQGDEPAAERGYAESLALRRAIGHRAGEAETLSARGALFARQSRYDEARADLERAVAIAEEMSLPAVALAARAWLAVLPGGDAAPVLAAVVAAGGAVSMEVRHLLWKATHDPAHLAEAKRLLDFMVDHAPQDCRGSMLANVRLHREIAAAAGEQTGVPGPQA